jgi:PKD repeat protein
LTTKQHYYAGLNVGEEFSWPFTITGGIRPYTVSWDWGDGTKQTFTVANGQDLAPSHQYAKANTYRVVVRVRDASGQEGVMTLVSVVNGAPQTVTATDRDGAKGTLTLVWPLLGATSLAVLSFWLGEHHKLALFRQH